MVTERRFFDDVTRVASGAAGALGGIRSRLEGELRDHVDRLLARMNLVTREEHDVVAAMAAKARAEQEALAKRLAALEERLGMAPVKPASAGKARRPKAAAGSKTPRAKSRGNAPGRAP